MEDEIEIKKSARHKNGPNLPSLPPINIEYADERTGARNSRLGKVDTPGLDSLRQMPDDPHEKHNSSLQNSSDSAGKASHLKPSTQDDIDKVSDSASVYSHQQDTQRASMAEALKYRYNQSLHNERSDIKFSYWKHSMQWICDMSNSHPSFTIYAMFLNRFFFLMLCVALFSVVQLINCIDSSYYDDKDIRVSLERTTLGNIDGLTYMNSFTTSTEIQIENADKSRDIMLSMDLVITGILMLFTLYHIYCTNFELRNLKHIMQDKDCEDQDLRPFPISVKEFAVRIHSIEKGYSRNLEGDIRNLFVRYGGFRDIVEVIPIYKYNNMLTNELKLRELHLKIRSFQCESSITGKGHEKEIDGLKKAIEKYEGRQTTQIQKAKDTDSPHEAIVVFNKIKYRTSCLKEYSQYSHWWSRSKSMSENLKLNREYSFKVSQAYEPFEINPVKSTRCPGWMASLYILLGLAIIATICSVVLVYSIRVVKDAYEEFPTHRECVQYGFSTSTVAGYKTSTTATKQEISCYCRYHGWDTVQNNGGSDASLNGLKSLCSAWTDDRHMIDSSIVLAIFCMLACNLLITYGFKVMYSKSLVTFRYITDRHILISLSVFFFNSFFLGVVPTLVFDQSEHDMPRSWYLKTGVLHLIYFLALLVMHPLEYLILYLTNKIYTKIRARKCVLQKDLNQIMVGLDLDYSHKIGRLLSHMLIVFLLGPGLPLLYSLFFVHLLIFCCIEKACMLSLYQKCGKMGTYIRWYSIHILFLVLLVSCINAVSIYGNEDIFPSDTEKATGIYEGVLLEYNKPVGRTYGDKIVLTTGIPYLILFIFSILTYAFLLLVHLDIAVLRVFKNFSIKEKPLNVGYLKYSSTLLFEPKSYDFKLRSKYGSCIRSIEKKLQEKAKDFRKKVAPDVVTPELLSPPNSGDNEADASARKFNASHAETSQNRIYANKQSLIYDNDPHAYGASENDPEVLDEEDQV